MRFSYVISYRSDEGRRAANLRAVLRWLSTGLPNIEIILVEQDRLPRVSAQLLPPNCRHIFLRNDGPFNKSWGYNVGFRRCRGQVIGFGDADLIMDSSTLADCFERCEAEFEAVKPYDRLIDLTLEESQRVLDGDLDIRMERIPPAANREGIGEHISFGGGLFLIRYECFERLGGFDERFRGWGGEDDAMTIKLRLIGKKLVVENRTIYHLFHERANPHLHPHYGDNLTILREYARASDDSLKALCASQRQSMGDASSIADCGMRLADSKTNAETGAHAVAQMLETARRHQRAGEFQQAETLYQQILAVDPRHAAALHLLGVSAHQTGNNGRAIELIGQALSVQPDYFEALHNLGQIYRLEGRMEEACERFQRALRLKPDSAEARNNLGGVLESEGRLEEARASYTEAVRLSPNYVEAHNNLGNVLKSQRRFAEAEASLRRAIHLRPDYAVAHNNLGSTLMALGRLEEAAACFAAALRLQPGFAWAHHNLGQALFQLGKVEEALASYRQAIRVKPDFLPAHDHLAQTLVALNRLDAAEAVYRGVLRLQPDLAEAHNDLANVLAAQQKPEDALAECQEALRRKPDFAIVYNTLGNVLKDLGRLEEALAAYREAIELRPGDAALHSNLVYAASFHPDYDAAGLDALARQWNEQHAVPLAGFIRPHPHEPVPERKLRIGYVSADFREHSATFFTTPLLANHDRRQFEIFCYANNAQADAHTARLRGYADVWRPIVRLSDPQFVELVRKDRIDILVDLSMHMASNRALAFARKPAPIQVAWLAYPGTTGMTAMDYRLTDPYLDPPGLNDALYTEESIRLPDSFWCYDPLTAEPPVNALPAMQNGFITFGCLNYFAKVNDATLTLWAKVLRAVPLGRLLLLAPAGSARTHVLDRLGQEGIDPARVQFTDRRPRLEYLHLHRDIDIGLDLLPANGHTTSLDAFWMGVPTPTLVGKTLVGRAGWSQLNNLGLRELAAQTPDEYVEIVAQLARDLPRLQELRATLRQRMLNSPLMDGQRFAQNMEQAYRQMWRAWCNQRPLTTAMVTPLTPPEIVQRIIEAPLRLQPDGWWTWPNVQEGLRQGAAAAIACTPAYPGTFAGRGIVIAGGGSHFASAYVTIRMLRHVGCSLPIELWHFRGELTEAMRRTLRPHGVACVDADQLAVQRPFRFLHGHKWKGWQLKPYAIVHCGFRQVLYLDADCYPTRDPEFLFDWPCFRERGAIFWPDLAQSAHLLPEDRWLIFGTEAGWPSLESGQMVLDKETCWQELQLALWYNAAADLVYNIVWGDKDTYNIAWRRLGTSYCKPWPSSDWNMHTILHYDPDGAVLFQHRVADKFRLAEERFISPQQGKTGNVFNPRLAHEQTCFRFLEELRQSFLGTQLENGSAGT